MLRLVVLICERYTIPYFLMEGSLLGALRHEGFIPWDADIDIGMLNTDFDRFTAAYRLHLAGSGYPKLHSLKDSKYNNIFLPARVRDDASCQVELRDQVEALGAKIPDFDEPLSLDIKLFDVSRDGHRLSCTTGKELCQL